MKKADQVIFNLPDRLQNVARYMWSTFADATGIENDDLPARPFVIHSSGAFPISHSFNDLLSGNIQRVASRYQLPEGLDIFRAQEPLACAFYLLNSLHEWVLPLDKYDKYGRYPYLESIQYATNTIQVNLVQSIFDDTFQNITGRSRTPRKSELFWSHDIDYLHSAWRNDLILAWRNRDLRTSVHLIWRALRSPGRWNNISEILELEKDYGIRSVFFWLARQGKSQMSGLQRIDHADYNFSQPSMREIWETIQKTGSRHGIHKSAFESSITEEIMNLPHPVHINRNHFLKLRLPDHYHNIEKSGLLYDASLGFAEHFGFRNSFGRPFHPYNIKTNQPYSFVEYPLHLMDATFQHYLGDDLHSMTRTMTEFINQHRHDCTLGILIHNSSINFTDEKEMVIWKQFFTDLRDFPYTIPTQL